MLAALKHKDLILSSFYLEDDNITIRHSKDCTKGKFKAGDEVVPYTLKGSNGNDYKGIWIPGGGTTISLPWILTVLRKVEFKDKTVIDHKNGDITDNSADNLRVVSQQQNCKNKRMRYDNTTGYTGISYHKGSRTYQVRRTINGKRINKSSKTLDGAIALLEELTKLSYSDGYTERHGL